MTTPSASPPPSASPRPAASALPGAPVLPAAFWLLPSAADAGHLQGLIDTLAKAHAGPTFEPHLTLHVAECPAGTDIERVLDLLASRHAPLELQALATGHSAAYYKAVFANISLDGADGARLTALRRDLVGQLPACGGSRRDGAPPASGAAAPAQPDVGETPAPYHFLPHLSLLYGELPAELRNGLAERYDLQARKLRFDRIAAVRPAPGHRDLSRVAHWEVYGHRQLKG